MADGVCVTCGEKARLRGRDYRSLCDRHYMEEKGFPMIVVHDVIEANGKTIRENNETKGHNIPLGTLVEIKYDHWFGDGACEKVHARLWVVEHARDCDGSPLYTLSKYRDAGSRDPQNKNLFAPWTINGYDEESLTPVPVTPDLVYGEGALTWDEDKA